MDVRVFGHRLGQALDDPACKAHGLAGLLLLEPDGLAGSRDVDFEHEGNVMPFAAPFERVERGSAKTGEGMFVKCAHEVGRIAGSAGDLRIFVLRLIL